MDGSSVIVSTDVCMLENCFGKEAWFEEELDQLQRSKKKSNTVVKESDRNYVDVVMETPVDLQLVKGNKIQDDHTTASPIYDWHSTLRNRKEDLEPSTRFYADLYDEGYVFDDNEVNLEKEDLICPTIYLTKAEKIRLWSP